MKTGESSSQDGTRIPQGRVSSRTSSTTLESMTSDRALSTVKNALPGSRSTLPSGIPRWLPASQAVFSVR